MKMKRNSSVTSMKSRMNDLNRRSRHSSTLIVGRTIMVTGHFRLLPLVSGKVFLITSLRYPLHQSLEHV